MSLTRDGYLAMTGRAAVYPRFPDLANPGAFVMMHRGFFENPVLTGITVGLSRSVLRVV